MSARQNSVSPEDALARDKALPARRVDLLPVNALAIWAVCAYLLLSGDGYVFTIYANDAFIFWDGALRLTHGQTPHVDFGSPLGPLTYVPLWAGYRLSGGSFGAAIPVASVILAGLFAAAGLWIALARLGRGASLGITAALIVMSVAPSLTGTTGFELTQSMYYNRWGWVALTLVFLMLAPPRTPAGPARETAETALLAALFLFLAYLKVTYAVFAFAGVAAYVAGSANWKRNAGIFAGLVLITAAVLELLYGFHFAYIGDVLSASQASGAVRHGPFMLIGIAVANAFYLTLFAWVWTTLVLSRGFQWRDAGILGLTGFASIIIVNHNHHAYYMPALIAGIVYCLARLPSTGTPRRVAAVLLGIFLVQPILVGSFALLFHRYAPREDVIKLLDDVYVLDQRGKIAQAAEDKGAGAVVDGFAAAMEGRPLDAQTFLAIREVKPRLLLLNHEYAATLEDGKALLARNSGPECSVMTLDFNNPFNLMLGRVPPAKVPAWFHYKLTFSEKIHPAPEDLFRNTPCVMEPVYPLMRAESNMLRTLYLPYVRQNYQLAEESAMWRLWMR